LKARHLHAEIALIVGKHQSTISREILRNSAQRGYRPIQVQRLYDQRKQGKYKRRFSASDWHLQGVVDCQCIWTLLACSVLTYVVSQIDTEMHNSENLSKFSRQYNGAGITKSGIW